MDRQPEPVIPAAISLPRGENILFTGDILAELLRVIQRDAQAGNWQSERLAEAERTLERAVRRQQRAGSPNALPAGLHNLLGVPRHHLQALADSDQKAINLDQAAPLLGVTSRERARQLVRQHKLHCWPHPDGRHELRVFRAEVIALAEKRSGGHGAGSNTPEGQGNTPGGRHRRREQPASGGTSAA